MAQRRKRKIDLGHLLEACTLRASFGDPFTTCEIDEVQLSDLEFEDLFVLVLVDLLFFEELLNADLQKGVRPTRHLVHVGGSSRAVFHTGVKQRGYLVGVRDDVLGEIFDVKACLGVLAHMQSVFRVRRKKVPDLLVIDFQIACPHCKLFILFADREENVAEGPRHDTFQLLDAKLATHGVSFASTCLTIRKYSSVVAQHHVFYDLSRTLIINLLLRGRLIVNVVESVGLPHIIWGRRVVVI